MPNYVGIDTLLAVKCIAGNKLKNIDCDQQLTTLILIYQLDTNFAAKVELKLANAE